jgi:hypothetical protein
VNTLSRWIGPALLGPSMLVLLAVREADAKGGHGGHSGGRAAQAPRFSARPQAYKAPRIPSSTAPARTSGIPTAKSGHNVHASKNTHGPAHSNHAQANAATTRSAGTVNTSHAGSNAAGSASTGIGNPGAISINSGSSIGGVSPNTYTFGYGRGAHPYTAYGYGRGYRASSYGRGYGYGRSQGNNRAIIARLRSVNASLARVNHDYRGHRVAAMRSVSMAIRQLSHGSIGYRGIGFRSGGNNGLGMGMPLGGGRGPGGNGAGQPMTQAQSDARMSQNLRNLQGINMQLSSQSYRARGHAAASAHVQQAMRHLQTALAIR